jgi:hypothetical protein
MTDKEAMAKDLEELAGKFSDGWHEGIKIDASDIMLLNEAAQALAQPEQEPVAWLVEFENGEQELHFDEQSVGEIHTPLYTNPPKD